MKDMILPADSKGYSDRAFVEKDRWHRQKARMSLTRKIQALDRLLEMAKFLPKLEDAPRSTQGESTRPTRR